MSDISVDRQSDQSIDFQYYDSDGTTARSLVDCTVKFTVKGNAFDNDDDDESAYILKNVTSHINAAQGQSQILLTPSDTYLDPLNYFYTIKVKEADGKIYTAQTGRLRVSANASNRTV